MKTIPITYKDCQDGIYASLIKDESGSRFIVDFNPDSCLRKFVEPLVIIKLDQWNHWVFENPVTETNMELLHIIQHALELEFNSDL